MIPVILGGIALAATGYKLKKHFEDDDNYEKLHDSLIEGYEWIDRLDHKIDAWFDTLTNAIETPSSGKKYHVHLSTELKGDMTSEDILEPFQEMKSRLYKTLFRETEGLKRSVKNLRGERSMPIFGDLDRGVDTLKDTAINKVLIDSFSHILTKAESFQYQLLDELELPFSKVDDYEQMSNREKVKAIRLMEIDSLMEDACSMAITYDGLVVSKRVRRAFIKLYTCIENH